MSFPQMQLCTALPSFETLEPITQTSDVVCSKCNNLTEIYFTEISPICSSLGDWQGNFTLSGYLYCEYCQEIIAKESLSPFCPMQISPLNPAYKPKWKNVGRNRLNKQNGV